MIVIVWARQRTTGGDSTVSFPSNKITIKQAIKRARTHFPRRRWKLTSIQIVGFNGEAWHNETCPK